MLNKRILQSRISRIKKEEKQLHDIQLAREQKRDLEFAKICQNWIMNMN